MKLKLKKISLNNVMLVVSVIAITIYLMRLAKEKYEESVGPSMGPGEVKEVAEKKQLTQSELDAVLKFIR